MRVTSFLMGNFAQFFFHDNLNYSLSNVDKQNISDLVISLCFSAIHDTLSFRLKLPRDDGGISKFCVKLAKIFLSRCSKLGYMQLFQLYL